MRMIEQTHTVRSAMSELRTLREHVQVRHRQTEIVEQCLREMLAKSGLKSDTIEIIDAIPRLNGGAQPHPAPADASVDDVAVAAPYAGEAVLDRSWWPTSNAAPRALVPNPGWACYALRGRVRKVIGISVCGLRRKVIAHIVGMIAAQQRESGDFIPLFLTDSSDFDLFRDHGFVFEYLPGPDKRAKLAGVRSWAAYAAERREFLRRKWDLSQIVVFGPMEFGT